MDQHAEVQVPELPWDWAPKTQGRVITLCSHTIQPEYSMVRTWQVMSAATFDWVAEMSKRQSKALEECGHQGLTQTIA